VKIKRKEYERLQTDLAYQQRINRTRIIIECENGPLLDVDLEQLGLSARYGATDREDYTMIRGPIRFKVIPPEYATGYDAWLLSKYTGPDDEPWPTIAALRLKLSGDSQ
jgi:hypothetical protein